MSGGHFNYSQYTIGDIRAEIEELIDSNNITDTFGFTTDYPEHIIMEFKEAVKVLQRAEIFVNRIDWFVSGDDGEESFMRRLMEDLKVSTQETK